MKIIITESQLRFITLQSWVDQLNKVIADFDKINCDGDDYFKYKLYCEKLSHVPLEKLILFKDELEDELASLVNQEFHRAFSK